MTKLSEFQRLLLEEAPHYDAQIIKSIRPESSWVGIVSCQKPHWRGTGIIQFFSPYDLSEGEMLFSKKFNSIYPDMLKHWN